MKPRRLEMHAFGPFADREIIDFDKLGNSAFFLIHGDTGAGKSTILDAMTYALYGETSGDERDGEQMRSQYAKADSETLVEFDFDLAGKTYSVIRRPGFYRPKIRGEGGDVKISSKAEVYLVEEGKKALIDSGVSKVDAFIVKILGFSAAQFRQVVVLPQGKFDRLLKAGSDERQVILAQLFATERYKKIEELLKNKANLIKQSLAETTKDKEKLLERIGVASPEAVSALLDDLRERLEKMEQEQVRLEAMARSALEDLNAGKLADGKLAELSLATQSLKQLMDAQAEYAQKKNELDAARKAAGIEEVLRNREARKVEARAAELTFETTKLAQESAVAAMASAERALQNEEARAGEREVAERGKRELESMVEKVEGLQNAIREKNVAQNTYQSARADVEKFKTAVDDGGRWLDKARAELDAVKQKAGEVGALGPRLETAKARLRDRRQLDTSVKLLGELEGQLTGAQRQHITGEQAVELARKGLDSLDRAWRLGQAVVLAKVLDDGQACPVCGSTHHPVLASADLLERDVPSMAEIDSARKKVDESTALSTKYASLCAVLSERLENDRRLIESQRGDLGDYADIAISQIEVDVSALELALAEAVKAESALPAIEKTVSVAESAEESAKKALETAKTAESEAQANLHAKIELVGERGAAVPEALRQDGALAQALNGATKVVETMQKSLRTAQDSSSLAAQALAAARSSFEAAIRMQANALASAESASQEFEERLKIAGFIDENYMLSVRRSSSEISALDGDIRRYDAGMASARDRLERASVLADGVERADLEQLKATADEAGLRRADHAGLTGEHKSLVKAKKELAYELDKLLKSVAEVEKQHSIIGKLHSVASGSNTAKVTFERYVLGALLDDVLVAASGRLLEMSQKRYELRRAADVKDGRKASGLDLEVLDGYTGQARRVATLSGGEGFMASLSLALGLVDVVQAQAGGIKLDTIFVDEGFGSLDPESLRHAIDTLRMLQQNQRLVGIISHVPELKEQIDVRLEVNKAREGSTTRFVLP